MASFNPEATEVSSIGDSAHSADDASTGDRASVNSGYSADESSRAISNASNDDSFIRATSISALSSSYSDADDLPPHHPEYLLDKQYEVPGWLHSPKENRIVWHDPAAVADDNFPDLTESGYWAKVSSAAALREYCGNYNGYPNPPLSDSSITLFILPTTSLREAYDISIRQPHDLGVMAIRFLNRDEQRTKLYAGTQVRILLADINNARDSARASEHRLATEIETKTKYREEMETQFQEAEAAYKASPTAETHLEALAALSRLRAAHQVVAALLLARSAFKDLDESLNTKSEFLNQAMNDSTFIGCPVELTHAGGEWMVDKTGLITKAVVPAQEPGGDGGVAAPVAAQEPGGGGGNDAPVADDHMDVDNASQ